MREWITELTKTIFSEDTGLFTIKRNNYDFSYFPSTKAKKIYPGEEYKQYFRFAGQVLAKALFEGIPIQMELNKTILGRLLSTTISHFEVSLEDLRGYDYQIYQSMKFIAEDPYLNLDKEDFTFTVMRDDGVEVELVKNGA